MPRKFPELDKIEQMYKEDKDELYRLVVRVEEILLSYNHPALGGTDALLKALRPDEWEG